MQTRNILATNQKLMREQNVQVDKLTQRASRLETIIQEFETYGFSIEQYTSQLESK